jgi:hypothetical protein
MRNSHAPTDPDSNRARLIARVVRDLLGTHRFADHADLKAAVWGRLHGLHIRAMPVEVDEALTLIGSNTPLVAAVEPPELPAGGEPEVPALTREDARLALDRVRAGLQVAGGPRSMPRVVLGQGQAHRVRLLAQAIRMLAEHVDALEDEVEKGQGT